MYMYKYLYTANMKKKGKNVYPCDCFVINNDILMSETLQHTCTCTLYM